MKKEINQTAYEIIEKKVIRELDKILVKISNDKKIPDEMKIHIAIAQLRKNYCNYLFK